MLYLSVLLKVVGIDTVGTNTRTQQTYGHVVASSVVDFNLK